MPEAQRARVEALADADPANPEGASIIARFVPDAAKIADEEWLRIGRDALAYVTRVQEEQRPSAPPSLLLEDWICCELGEPQGLAGWLRAEAVETHERGDRDATARILERAVSVHRELSGPGPLAECLRLYANILLSKKDSAGAMAMAAEAEQLCVALGDADELFATLGTCLNIRALRGEVDAVLGLADRQRQLFDSVRDRERVTRLLALESQLIYSLACGLAEDPRRAVHCLRMQEWMLKQTCDEGAMITCLRFQGVLRSQAQDHEAAVVAHRKEEVLCRKQSDREALRKCLELLSSAEAERGHREAAIALLEEEAQICRDLGNKDDLLRSLRDRALLLGTAGDAKLASATLGEAESICREKQDLRGLEGCLGDQALILQHEGDLDGAMLSFEQQAAVLRRLNDAEGLFSCLSDQVRILERRGDLGRAESLMREAEAICRALWP